VSDQPRRRPSPATATPEVVAITAASTALGRRVVQRLRADPHVARVVRLGAADLRGDVKRRLDGVDVVVHLASTTLPVDAAPTRLLLDAAGAVEVRSVVVVSSALVYGAAADNPVPLTEEAPLAVTPEFEPAVVLGEVERLAASLRNAHPAMGVAVLRPAVPVAEDELGWLARMFAAVRNTPVGDADPPGQFVHLDDLAAAVTLAQSDHLDGAYNVAPDGWIPGEDLRALAGGPRLRLPGRLAEQLTSWRWRAGLSPTPPGLLPHTEHPWVVAGDKLRAAGWVPAHSNQEAFVVGHRPSPWATVSPQRRQELALAVSGLGLLGAGVGAAALVRGAARRARLP
jgi:nucleoside-diphosphate-sugar epimerase